MSMNKEELKKLLPHREPMLLLDEAELVGDEPTARSRLRVTSTFCRGIFRETR